jgi:hypothetical protein
MNVIQVKFSELTLDMFRMMLSLEHELTTPKDMSPNKVRRFKFESI